MNCVILFEGRPTSANKRLGGAASGLEERILTAFAEQETTHSNILGHLTGIIHVYFDKYNDKTDPALTT